MYPRLLWELAVDTLGFAQQTLGTTAPRFMLQLLAYKSVPWFFITNIKLLLCICNIALKLI